ncbi:Imm52 family immunity protein [Methylovirgula sp. HY1]|uniref:Imm52 family immunity protein n=1 Tax=Methylovirgula sp. HY1 TaxID=2822761 RepID=UPI001C5A9009|nr:Imm52 family immunity protein [Methylovirgula sp. HY1]
MALSEGRATQLGEGEAKAMTLSRYAMVGFWGARQETPEALALRFNHLIDRLALIDPVLSNWIWINENRKPIQFARIQGQLAEKIAAAVAKADDGEPVPIFGYRFGTLNVLGDTPRLFDLSIHAGSWIENDSFYSNKASLTTDYYAAPDPAIVTYKIFKQALLAIAESFEVTFCAAFPNDLMDLWPKGQKFRFGWINYVSPRFAPLVTPPKSAFVEYRQNGGLLMAATDETFITSNPQHLAAARDIEAALAPLNALPWPLDEGADNASPLS